MTPLQLQRNQHFLRDLRANEKKAIRLMRDNKGGRCCLCVALDTAIEDGFECDYDFNDTPPIEIKEWYGWMSHDPVIDYEYRASNLNDGMYAPEKTHAEIADLFEKKFNIPKEDVK